MIRAFVLYFVVLSISANSQMLDFEDVHPSDIIQPKFNGGGFDNFQHFVYSRIDFTKVKPGKVVASFTINTEGELTNLRIVEFNQIESASEIIRVLKLSPKWESAKRGGRPYSVTLKLPFNFVTKR